MLVNIHYYIFCHLKCCVNARFLLERTSLETTSNHVTLVFTRDGVGFQIGVVRALENQKWESIINTFSLGHR